MGKPPDGGKTFQEYEYNKNDVAPYRVIVQLLDDKDGAVHINKLTFGQLMTKTETYRQSITNIRTLGKYKLIVFLGDLQAANQLKKDPVLKEHNYKAYIPRSFVSVSGVVAGVPVDMTMEEIRESISCSCPILNINRLHRFEGGRKIPTSRIGIIFRASQLPREVRMFCCINTVRPFVNRPILCLNCLRYNHQTENCRSKKRCPNCAAVHEGLQTGECDNPKKCFYCKSEHRTSDMDCPERIRQRNIKTIMARTTLTYMEAKEQNPILTQNRYDILSNEEEYPALPQSYSAMVAGEYTAKPSFRPKPQRTKRPLEEVVIADQVEVFADRKKKASGESSNNGIALFNKFRVTDFERWAQKTAEQRSQEINQQLSDASASSSGAEGVSKSLGAINRSINTEKKSKERSRSRSRLRDKSNEACKP